MRRLLTCTFFASALVLGTVIPARALRIAVQPPSPTRVAVADAVLIGRVVGMEDKDVSVSAYPGAPPAAKATYRVAVVQVADTLKGDKGLKTVRVGFFPPPMLTPPGGGPGGVRPGVRPAIRPGMPRVNLKVGDAGLFYLTKHFQEPLYLATGPYDLTARSDGNFDKELAEVRANLKLLEDPIKSLKSADNKTRFMTAALLLARYRNFRPGPTKTEPISAEESKLILTALAEADGWATPANFREPLHPQMLFNQLGLTPKDGWQPPARVTSPQDYPNAMRAWLREHANTYRIQQIVPAAAPPAPAPAPGASSSR
jgi:hypothetical protein